MYKKVCLVIILIGCMLVSGCKNKQSIDTIEEVTKLSPTAIPTVSNTPTISNAPTDKPTNIVTLTPTLSPASILEEEQKSLLSFEVQPITVAQDLETPYMTKEEFPVLDGSTANIPLGEAIYCYLTGASVEEAKSDLKFYKTTESYERLMNGDSDILFVYEPSQTILADMMRNYTEFEFKALGRDALIFIANESNVVSSLTQQEIYDIYTGKTRNWSELGGNNQEIMAFQRPESSGSQTLLEKLAVPASKLMNGPQVIRPAEMGDLIDTLASYNNDSNSLGYSVYFYANYMYSKPGLKFLAIDGVLPTNETIQKGEYPYVNDFYVVIRKGEAADSKARILYNYMTTKEAQTLLARAGYVPVVDVEATDPTIQTAVEIQGELKLKPGQYLIDHNVSSEEVFEGDRILTADYRELLSFPSRYIDCGNSLVIDSDLILLKSYQTVNYGKTHYGYELYHILQQEYLTDHPYDAVYQTKEGLYSFSKYNQQLDETEYVYFSTSGTLICRLISKDSEHNFLEVVKDRVVHVQDNTLTYYNNEGKLIKQINIPYENVSKANISSQWRYTNEDYLWLLIDDSYLIIYDKDGNLIDDLRFTKNLERKPQLGKPWITASIVGTDGHLYVVGEFDRNIYLLRDDGEILFEKNTTYESYNIRLSGHLFRIYDQLSNNRYYMSLEGEILNPDGKEFPMTNDAIIIPGEGEFTVYPDQTSEVYVVKDKLYDKDRFYGREGETNPYLTYYYTITDREGNYELKSNFLGLRSFNDYAWVRPVGDHFILGYYSNDGVSYYSELIDKKGKTLFKSKENETITGVIFGDEIYVAVNSGNYEEIQDLKGKYLYREISNLLTDD